MLQNHILFLKVNEPNQRKYIFPQLDFAEWSPDSRHNCGLAALNGIKLMTT